VAPILETRLEPVRIRFETKLDLNNISLFINIYISLPQTKAKRTYEMSATLLVNALYSRGVDGSGSAGQTRTRPSGID